MQPQFQEKITDFTKETLEPLAILLWLILMYYLGITSVRAQQTLHEQ